MASWSTWWVSLQPAYRIKEGSARMDHAEKDDEWDHLVVGGNNGIYIIVISLSWLLRSIQAFTDSGGDGVERLRQEAQQLVDDVCWVFEQIKKAAVWLADDVLRLKRPMPGPADKRPQKHAKRA
ncbi:hypothetical protein EVG20_g11603 [Dentipellis fragilis]|uniref:Uncharacterized protein n=1 Tax=Dentipellis fragilis TaxID=205917 RepID=A0A4Y9XK17_9AGAM|nr:hypothetical protein EVG20_g11603 [Dentipellis fragilis]